MPLYEYECTACHRHTEKIQKFSDPEITACPRCSGILKRVITAPAISFKGGGWYADGYGNAKPAAAESKSSDAKPGESKPSSNSGGTEASGKPAAGESSTPSAPTPAVVAPSAPASTPKV